MKNITLILLLSLSISGCGEDQYAIEKKYWQLQKSAGEIFRNPDVSPPRELEAAVGAFNDFILKYPKNKLAVVAEFEIARLYMAKKEYDNARAQLENIITKYAKNEIICSDARFLIGTNYELEDKWDSALAQYRRLYREYPMTPRGLNVPIYIAARYKSKYKPDKMIEAYQEAAAHYNGLCQKHPKSILAYSASLLRAQCYGAIKDWPAALSVLSVMLEEYKGFAKLDEVLLAMSVIYARELKDRPKAKGTLEVLLKDFPRSRFRRAAEALIKELEKQQKEKA